MALDIVQRNHNGLSIPQRKTDGYINATAMARAHMEGTGEQKLVGDWLRLEHTKEAIEHLSLKTGIPIIKLVESRRGRYGGTWIHPRLSIRFAIWLSHDFGYLVEDWVGEWMKEGKAPAPVYRLTGVLLNYPKGWTEHFSSEWFDQAERITGYNRNSLNMANFINLAVYHRMPVEVRDRLDQLNARVDLARPYKQHQFFTEEAGEDLKRAINSAYWAMVHADCRDTFLENLRRTDNGHYQLSFGITPKG